MFGSKKGKPQIDQEQFELIQNAQQRIKQKKRLYYHFVAFLVGAIFIIIANVVLGVGKDFRIMGKEWFVFAIFAWLAILLVHLLNVFVTQRFMGKAWEQRQLEKLVTKQQIRIEKIKSELKKEAPIIAESEVYNEEIKAKKGSSEIIIIVAAGENDAIGKDNKLIWHLSDDLKRFKKLTSGHHIIMGRKTFETFPKPLPNRTHVVITRQSDYKAPEGVIVVNSLKAAIETAKDDSHTFIIGGGEIYKQAMDIAHKLEITRVHAEFDADTFFPKIDSTIWKEVHNTFHKKDSEHAYEFSFLTYVRK